MGAYWVDVRCVPIRAAAVLCGEKGFAGDEFEAVCPEKEGARRGAGWTGGYSYWVGPSVVVFILEHECARVPGLEIKIPALFVHVHLFKIFIYF